MKQVSYPAVEQKLHPYANASIAAEGCVDRSIDRPTDHELARELIQVYGEMREFRTLSSPSGEWTWILGNSREEYRSALATEKPDRLIPLLRNFFRNDLSFGLVSHATFEALNRGDDDALIEFASAMLLDLDTWMEFCDSPPLKTLEAPLVGNPFGILVDGTLVAPDTTRHSYHARRMRDLMDPSTERTTVLEIGGGYGGAFWRLWSDSPENGQCCYINVDLEESLFLFYYYVLTSSRSATEAGGTEPRLKWAIDGVVTEEDTHAYDVVLVPASVHASIDCGIDIAYNSNSLSEMSREDIHSYFETIHRNKPGSIFHQNSNFFPWEESSRGHVEILARDFPVDRVNYREVYRAVSPWMGAHGRYREYLWARRT